MRMTLACSKVDGEIKEKDSVRYTVEDDPGNTVIVIKEWNTDWQNNKIGNE